VFLTNDEPTKESLRVKTLDEAFKKWGVNKANWFTEMKVKDQLDRLKKLPAK
jgi:hypothetical protein